MSGADSQVPGYYTGPPVKSAEQPATPALEQKDGNQPPQGYYAGPPASADGRQPPAVAEQKDMHQGLPGYYNGRPGNLNPGKQPADEPRTKPNFFAKCFACGSTSGNA